MRVSWIPASFVEDVEAFWSEHVSTFSCCAHRGMPLVNCTFQVVPMVKALLCKAMGLFGYGGGEVGCFCFDKNICDPIWASTCI